MQTRVAFLRRFCALPPHSNTIQRSKQVPQWVLDQPRTEGHSETFWRQISEPILSWDDSSRVKSSSSDALVDSEASSDHFDSMDEIFAAALVLVKEEVARSKGQEEPSVDVSAMQRFIERLIELDACYPKSRVIAFFVLSHDTAKYRATKQSLAIALRNHVTRFKNTLKRTEHMHLLLPLVKDLLACWKHEDLTAQLSQMSSSINTSTFDDIVVPQVTQEIAEHIENRATSAPIYTSYSRVLAPDVWVSVAPSPKLDICSSLADERNRANRVVFVSNLHYGVTEEALLELFSLYGVVEGVSLFTSCYERLQRVRYDRDSIAVMKKNEQANKSSQHVYAFITFEDPATADLVTTDQCRVFGILLSEKNARGKLQPGGRCVYTEKAAWKRTLVVRRIPWNASIAEILQAIMEKLAECPDCPSLKFEVLNSQLFKDEQVQNGERKCEIVEHLNLTYDAKNGVSVDQSPPVNPNFDGLDSTKLCDDDSEGEDDVDVYVPAVPEMTKESVRARKHFSHWRRNDGVLYLRFPTFEDAFWAKFSLLGFMLADRKVAVDFSVYRMVFVNTKSGPRFVDSVVPPMSATYNNDIDPFSLYGIDPNDFA